MPQRSTHDFLTTQTLRERFGLKQITNKPTPMAAMRTDLFRKIDTLENKLDSVQMQNVFIKVALVGLLLVSLSEAAIIYYFGLLP